MYIVVFGECYQFVINTYGMNEWMVNLEPHCLKGSELSVCYLPASPSPLGRGGGVFAGRLTRMSLRRREASQDGSWDRDCSARSTYTAQNWTYGQCCDTCTDSTWSNSGLAKLANVIIPSEHSLNPSWTKSWPKTNQWWPNTLQLHKLASVSSSPNMAALQRSNHLAMTNPHAAWDMMSWPRLYAVAPMHINPRWTCVRSPPNALRLCGVMV